MKAFMTRIIASPFSYALAGVLTMCAMLLLRVYAHMGIEWCLLLLLVATALVTTAAYMQVVYSGRASEVTERALCWATILLWLLVGLTAAIRMVWVIYAILC